jgi:hypothetical protein
VALPHDLGAGPERPFLEVASESAQLTLIQPAEERYSLELPRLRCHRPILTPFVPADQALLE